MSLGLVNMNSERNDNEINNPEKMNIDKTVYRRFENTNSIACFCMMTP